MGGRHLVYILLVFYLCFRTSEALGNEKMQLIAQWINLVMLKNHLNNLIYDTKLLYMFASQIFISYKHACIYKHSVLISWEPSKQVRKYILNASHMHAYTYACSCPQTHNLLIRSKRPPLALSVAEMSGPKCPWQNVRAPTVQTQMMSHFLCHLIWVYTVSTWLEDPYYKHYINITLAH